MANQIHQNGKGDNIAGDKVMGNKVGNQVSNSNIGNVVGAAQDNAQVSASNFTQTSGTHTAELLDIVASLRQSVTRLPAEAQADMVIDIDDVEDEIKKPDDQRNWPRLKKRLTAIATAASVMAGGVAGGVAGANAFADEALELTNKVVELSDKVGIELQLPSSP